MAYRVTKWVKGRPYAYLQRSFREGGTVRTVSEYLGPVDPAGAPVRAARKKDGKAKARRASAGKPGDDDGASAADAAPASETGGKDAKGRAKKESYRDRLRLDPRAVARGLSESVARRQHANMVAMLGNAGIKAENVPIIAVRFGLKLAVKPRWRGGFVVTVPPFAKVKRRDVRAAYRLALGRAALEALRTQKPEIFATASVVMDASFRRTNAALLAYAKAGGYPDAWAWSFGLRWFGYANPLPGRKAEEMGLVGYGARKTWSDETAALLGKIAGSGWTAALAETAREERRAKADEGRALAALRSARGIMGRVRRPELRRRFRAAVERRVATGETATSMVVLGFYFGKIKATDGDADDGAKKKKKAG